jgi:hypothetical protein
MSFFSSTHKDVVQLSSKQLALKQVLLIDDKLN